MADATYFTPHFTVWQTSRSGGVYETVSDIIMAATRVLFTRVHARRGLVGRGVVVHLPGDDTGLFLPLFGAIGAHAGCYLVVPVLFILQVVVHTPTVQA